MVTSFSPLGAAAATQAPVAGRGPWFVHPWSIYYSVSYVSTE